MAKQENKPHEAMPVDEKTAAQVQDMFGEGEVPLKDVGGEYFFWNPLREEKKDGIVQRADKIELTFVPLERRQREKKKPTDGDQYYYIGFLTKPCWVKNLDKEWILAKAGSFVWVDERYALQAIQGFLPSYPKGATDRTKPSAFTIVRILPDSKRAVPGSNRTVWKMLLQAGTVNVYDHHSNKFASPKYEAMPLLPPATKVEPEAEPDETEPF